MNSLGPDSNAWIEQYAQLKCLEWSYLWNKTDDRNINNNDNLGDNKSDNDNLGDNILDNHLLYREQSIRYDMNIMIREYFACIDKIQSWIYVRFYHPSNNI